MPLHLIGCGRVILESVIPLDGYLAGSHIQHDITESATVVLISERHESFEAFLQMRSVVLDGFMLAHEYHSMS